MQSNLLSRSFVRVKTRVGSLWASKSAKTAIGNAPAVKNSSAPQPTRQLRQIESQLRECAREVGGQVTARARAAALGQAYAALTAPGKLAFLRLLAEEFGPNPKQIAEAHAHYTNALGTAEQWAAEMALREALSSPRSKILTQFNALEGGLKFLVELRADLLQVLDKHPELRVLDHELESHLASWFDVGFLELARISWNSPALLLEKLIQYEAVHEIQSWDDLKNRLDADRRCYGFFHPRMPAEPLIFVEVALASQLSGNIQSLLDERAPVLDPARADTAIFYSISSTQNGLRGVSFGNFLLKRVIEALQRDLPRLKLFSTLSPIPLFRAWVNEWLAGGTDAPLNAADYKRLALLTGKPSVRAALGEALDERKRSANSNNTALDEALREPMTKLLAYYLLEVKKGQLPLDPVARFHLGNGARIERLNWRADVSPKGSKQSYGMMVNYRYSLADIEENVEGFTREGKIAAINSVQRLARR